MYVHVDYTESRFRNDTFDSAMSFYRNVLEQSRCPVVFECLLVHFLPDDVRRILSTDHHIVFAVMFSMPLCQIGTYDQCTTDQTAQVSMYR
jgi:hypothetical protein